MNLRDLKVPDRPKANSCDDFTQYANLYAGAMIREEVKRRQFDRAGTQLTDPIQLGECRALLNLEQELWERANWQPEELPVTSENGVPE